MNLKEQIQRDETTLNIVNSWINNADNKVCVTCAVFSAVFGGLACFDWFISVSQVEVQMPLWRHCPLLLLGCIAIACSVVFHLLAILPKLTSRHNGTIRPSLFYGDIARVSFKKFRNFDCSMCDKQYKFELMSEIYINSKICYRKMRLFRYGVICSLAGLLFVCADLILRIFF
ncbi:hypothetical protein IJH89_01135 [Candidatus Saccharibacteria bacterium]|nr:hypothetical protein [Candidatus Saccharibacteria bacterium]